MIPALQRAAPSSENQPRRTAPALERAERGNEPRGTPTYRTGRSAKIWEIYQRILLRPSRHHRYVADQRPQRYRLSGKSPYGQLVCPQLVRMAGYGAALENRGGGIEP